MCSRLAKVIFFSKKKARCPLTFPSDLQSGPKTLEVLLDWGALQDFRNALYFFRDKPGKWYESERAEHCDLLFDALGNLSEHSKQVLLAAGK